VVTGTLAEWWPPDAGNALVRHVAPGEPASAGGLSRMKKLAHLIGVSRPVPDRLQKTKEMNTARSKLEFRIAGDFRCFRG